MALYKGRIIGAFSLIKKEDKKNYPGWWVYSLEISLPFRGVGVGNGLMQEAINFSREKKAPFIYLSVWDKLKPARKLYKKIGLREFGRETVKIPHEKNIRTHLLMKKELY
jgi:ribosomal protein S18 acetylase RimI-like enzyme